MHKELSGASEPNPFIMLCTQNFHMLMYCTIYYIMHTKLSGTREPNVCIYILHYAHKMYPTHLLYCVYRIVRWQWTTHVYYINHAKLSGASEPHTFIILCSQKCQMLVKQIHWLCYAYKICLQILQGRRHFAEWRCRWEDNVSYF